MPLFLCSSFESSLKTTWAGLLRHARPALLACLPWLVHAPLRPHAGQRGARHAGQADGPRGLVAPTTWFKAPTPVRRPPTLPLHPRPPPLAHAGPTAFMLGNEGHGMTDRQMALCDRFVYISQYGAGTASLNVAVAASIVLHQFALWAGAWWCGGAVGCG